MKRITMVILTPEETNALHNATWACFTPEADRRTGVTIARLLTEGIIIDNPNDLANLIAQQSGVDEITDTECRELIWERLTDIQDGTFPTLPLRN
jgi:hypothetical protein